MSAAIPDHRSSPSSSAGVTRVRWRVVLLAFLVVLLDGFDSVTLGLAIPTLTHEWGVSSAAFTISLTTTTIGMVIAYSTAGRLCARFGRRRVILWSTAVFAAGSAATALTTSVAGMSAVRFVTGAGLGMIVPAAISLAADNSPPHRRESTAILVSLGLSAGPFAAGISGGALIGNLGWTSLFWVGAVLPALVLPLLWWGMHEPGTRLPPTAPVESASVRRLFEEGRGPLTLMLWASALLVFMTQAVLAAWTPQLMASYGFTPTEAPLGTAALGFGGILGGLLLAALSAGFRAAKVVVVTCAIDVALIVLLARLQLGNTAVLALVGGVGLATLASLSAPPVIAMMSYPSGVETSGVGWTVAFGRVGSVLGPAGGGVLLALGVSARGVVLTACVPVLAAAVLFAFLSRRPGAGALQGPVAPIPAWEEPLRDTAPAGPEGPSHTGNGVSDKALGDR